jgi:hypothetical protein
VVSPWRLWSVLILLATVSLLAVAIPVWLIQPFEHQSSLDLSLSYFLKRWSPYAVPMLAGLTLLVAARLWRVTESFSTKLGMTLAVALSLLAAWFSWQNHFEWMFSPPADPGYAPAARASFVRGEDRVLGVEIHGDAVAYPIRALAYHHLVHDRVGGVDVVATY